MVGTVQDVTERKEMQTKLVHAERMASLGTLAGGVAHEINNPLACVLSNLEFMSRGLCEVEDVAPPGWLAETRQVIGETFKGAERVRRIVQDLRTFTRPSNKVGPVDMQQVLDLAITMASSQIQHRARLVRDYFDVPPVQGDASRLGQVALNLLVNAAQAIPDGKPTENEVCVVTRMDGAHRVVFEVRDTGCGIPLEIRRHLFEPFLTTKPVGKGTGLGLSVCHGIVTSLGGEITVESEVGKGSTFRVSIPVAGQAADPALLTTTAAPGHLSQGGRPQESPWRPAEVSSAAPPSRLCSG
jgi:signal transduction histidine kinase